MFEENYIIVQKPQSKLDDGSDDMLMGSSSEVLVGRGSDIASHFGEPEFERASLSDADALDAARDPKNIILMDMPLTLVNPVEMQTSDAIETQSFQQHERDAGVTWGVKEVLGQQPNPQMDGRGVKVAVLDTGIVSSHPAFNGLNIVGKNFTSDSDEDGNGHGTHCAGTIFGRNTDGIRIGVATGVTDALVAKVLDDDGRGSASAVLEALKWAHSEKANIVSMSLGFDFTLLQERFTSRGYPSRVATSKALKAYRDNLNLFQSLADFLHQENASNEGMVLVAASGNDSRREHDSNFLLDVSVPAAASAQIISVGATKHDGDIMGIADFSNIGPTLCAPGVQTLSADISGGLTYKSGTSMACPHVAGVAALHWQHAKEQIGRASGSYIRSRLEGGAVLSRFPPNSSHIDRGSGCVLSPQA